MKSIFYSVIVALCFVACQAEKEEASPPAPEPVVQYVDATQVAELLEAGGITVIDVRTPEEFGAGHIEGALNIDYQGAEFAEKIAALDPGATFLVHCAVGGRSTAALEAFEAAGLKQVYHLDGGYNGWKAAQP